MESIINAIDYWFRGTTIKKQFDRIQPKHLNKPLLKLISEDLKKSGNEVNEEKYKRMLEMLLPASILKSNDQFSAVTTNIKNNLPSNITDAKKVLHRFADAKLRWQTDGTLMDETMMRTVCNDQEKSLKNPDTFKDFEDSYKKAIYLVCCSLIKDKDISESLFRVIEDNEKDGNKSVTKKMYFEALMNYIIIRFFKYDVTVFSDKIKFNKDDYKDEILKAIATVEKILKRQVSSEKDKKQYNLTDREREIQSELLDLVGLSDVERINDIEDFEVNEEVLENADIDIVKSIHMRHNIINDAKQAFDNMQAATCTNHPTAGANNNTFNQKDNVINQLKEVSKKVFTSKDASAELIKKFINDPVFTIMNNTYKTPRGLFLSGTGADVLESGTDCRKDYYTCSPSTVPAANYIREKAVANKALKDKEFRERLDNEIKAKIKGEPHYFDTYGIAPAQPFGPNTGIAFNNPEVSNLYTNNTYIANENAMSYIEEQYITYLKQRLTVFNKASDLQKDQETKWIGDVIVELKPGLWTVDKPLDDIMNDIINDAKELFKGVGFEVDEKLKKDILTEIIKNINDISLKTRNMREIQENIRNVFNRVIKSLNICESENDILQLTKDNEWKENILKYKAIDDSGPYSFSTFIEKAIACIPGTNAAGTGGFCLWRNDNNETHVKKGVTELCNLLRIYISDKQELFATLRAVIGTVRYLYRTAKDTDKFKNNYDKFSEIVKKYLQNNNTQGIINYAKMNLHVFKNRMPYKRTDHSHFFETFANWDGKALRMERLYEILFDTSVEFPDNLIDECLQCINNNLANADGMKDAYPNLQDIIDKHNGIIEDFVVSQQNDGSSHIFKYTAYKRLGEGLKYLLAGNKDAFDKCFALSFDAHMQPNAREQVFTSRAIGDNPADLGGVDDDNHALTAAMFNILQDDEKLKRYNLSPAEIQKVFSLWRYDGRSNASSADEAQTLKVHLNGKIDLIKTIIKMCDEEAKELSPSLVNHFCVINAPSYGVLHKTNADKKLHMLMSSSDGQEYNKELLDHNTDPDHKPHPLAQNYHYNRNYQALDEIDYGLFIKYGIKPTSLFFQHNIARKKSLQSIENLDITESAGEIINPVVRQIVLRSVKEENKGWWTVSDVIKITKLVEQYRLTEADIDDLFDNCPVLLGKYDINILQAYLHVTKETLKDSPDLAKNYKKQLKDVYAQMYECLIDTNMFGDGTATISQNDVAKAMRVLLTECNSAHQLYAIRDKFEKAGKNKKTVFNQIIDGSIIKKLHAVNASVKAKQKITITKDGKEYKLNVLKTQMPTDPETSLGIHSILQKLPGGITRHNADLKNIRRKFLEKDNTYKDIFGTINDDCQTYLEIDTGEKVDQENKGNIVIIGKVDDYGVRFVKKLPFDNDKADFANLTEWYTADIYFDGDKQIKEVRVNNDGQVMLGGRLFHQFDYEDKKYCKEFLQILSVWKDVFGCKDDNELGRIMNAICNCLYNNDGRNLLYRLTELRKNIRDIKYQDILRLLRNEEYSYIHCPLDKERKNMIIELIKFKKDFICSKEIDIENCEELINKLQDDKDISLCSMADCKKLFSFIAPMSLYIDDVDFFKGFSDKINRKSNQHNKMFRHGVLRKINIQQSEKKDIDKRDERTNDKEGDKQDNVDQKEEKKDISANDVTEKNKGTDDKFGNKDIDKRDERTNDKEGDEQDNVDQKEEEDISANEVTEKNKDTDYKRGKTTGSSLHDIFGIKSNISNDITNNDDITNNNFNENDDNGSVLRNIVNSYKHQIHNTEMANRNKHIEYGNVPSSLTGSGRRHFGLSSNANYSNYNGPQQVVNQTGGMLTNMFKSFCASSRRQALKKQAQQNQLWQNNKVWRNGNGNFLQQQPIGSYSGNRRMNGLYNGFQTQNLSNSSSRYTQPSSSLSLSDQ